MTRYCFFICCLLLLAACKPGVPKDIIQPEKMEKILLDIHIADSYSGNLISADSAMKVIAPIYKGIYQKYEIDSAAQAKSMSWYYKHPEILSKMYDNILNRIKVARDKEQKIEEIAVKAKQAALKKDSLKLKNDSLKKIDTSKKNTPIKLKPSKDTLKLNDKSKNRLKKNFKKILDTKNIQ